MKRSLSLFLLLLCLIPCLFSCEKAPNMQSLLSYQKAGATFRILVDGKQKATVTLGEDTAVTLESGEFSTLVYRFSNGETSLSNGEFTVPLGSDSHIKAKKWAELFALPCDIPWHIEKTTLDGKAVYLCRTEEVTLRIALDGTPLLIESGETTLTVLGVS